MNSIQYTVRGIPEEIDRRARQRAAATNQSLNSVLVEALKSGLGVETEKRRYDDLDDLAGTWVKDPQFDEAIASMDKVDEGLWK